jgi:hypothetical protein
LDIPFYDFSKLLQVVICPVLEISGGVRKIHFHRLGEGVVCSNPHRLGGEVDFFLQQNGSCGED